LIRRTAETDAAARARYDALIDVRSPAEFAQDHLPGAINLPVLDNEERAEIGTLYVQTSRFLARRLGAAKVARNVATHLETALADRPANFQPLIYCWRGGQRSGAMATILAQVGWPVTVLEGGYRTWRRSVVARLYDETPEHLPRFILVDGPTGSGKTALLAALAARGEQVIDLESLAGHRGSLFGATPQGQPGQKLFESRLMVALEPLDPARPTFVEAESSRIGNLTLPPLVWAAMRAAPRLALSAPAAARTAHILETYADIAADPAALAEALSRLPHQHPKERRAHWHRLVEEGRLPELVAELIHHHYDPAYTRSSRSRSNPLLATVESDPTDLATAAEAATRIAWRG
jgi:tRNA 2-selenouridine synthase